MRDNLAMRKYYEVDEWFEKLSNEQAIVISLLNMERTWIPYCKVISETVPELIEYANQCMEMTWNRVIRGKVLSGECEKYNQLFDYIRNNVGDAYEPAYASSYPNYLIQSFNSGTGWFFEVDPTKIEMRSDIVMTTFDMVIGYIGDLLHLSLNNEEDERELEKNLCVQAEINRMNEDYELVMKYPENIEEILKKREYYHDLLVLEPFDEKILYPKGYFEGYPDAYLLTPEIAKKWEED